MTISISDQEALDAMTIPQIRRCQDLVRQQQIIAYKARNEWAMNILNQYERAYADAVYTKAFGDC